MFLLAQIWSTPTFTKTAPPPLSRKPFCYFHELSRLAEKFEFGGGKALPEEMTGPIMPIPSEVRWKASEARRIAETMRRRKGLPDNFVEGGGGEGSGKYSSQATTMFDQVQKALSPFRVSFLRCAQERRTSSF